MNKPLIIGIAGPSGAGKTTAGSKLPAYPSHIEHIRLDSYLKSPEAFSRKGQFLNGDNPKNFKFDLLKKHLSMLASNRVVVFSTDSDLGGHKITLHPKDVIVVEGTALFLDKAVREQLDVKIYFEATLSVVIHKRSEKNKGKIAVHDKKAVLSDYKKTGAKQRAFADYIINTRQPKERIKKKVLEIIDEELVKRGKKAKSS